MGQRSTAPPRDELSKNAQPLLLMTRLLGLVTSNDMSVGESRRSARPDGAGGI